MEPMVAELIDMRRRAPAGSVARRLAERCLELCFQEIAANDERFAPLPQSAVDEFVEVVVGALH